jgi:hypothetical protein
LEVLVVALQEQIRRGDVDHLRARFGERARRAVQLIAEAVHRAPEVADFQAEDHVGLGDEGRGAARRLVQRVM